MPHEVQIDMSHIVGAVASVFVQPYVQFVEKLRAEGRVTKEEVAELQHELDRRVPRLAELTKQRLAELDEG